MYAIARVPLEASSHHVIEHVRLSIHPLSALVVAQTVDIVLIHAPSVGVQAPPTSSICGLTVVSVVVDGLVCERAVSAAITAVAEGESVWGPVWTSAVASEVVWKHFEGAFVSFSGVLVLCSCVVDSVAGMLVLCVCSEQEEAKSRALLSHSRGGLHHGVRYGMFNAALTDVRMLY